MNLSLIGSISGRGTQAPIGLDMMNWPDIYNDEVNIALSHWSNLKSLGLAPFPLFSGGFPTESLLSYMRPPWDRYGNIGKLWSRKMEGVS